MDKKEQVKIIETEKEARDLGKKAAKESAKKLKLDIKLPKMKDKEMKVTALAPLLQTAYMQGVKEVVDWLQEFAIHGGQTPVGEVLGIMAVHSPFKPSSKIGD